MKALPPISVSACCKKDIIIGNGIAMKGKARMLTQIPDRVELPNQSTLKQFVSEFLLM